MKLSVGVVWDELEKKFFNYLENDAELLVRKIKTADLVVGFNVAKFDYVVLQPYSDFDFDEITTFYILNDIKKQIGHRLSLSHLAEYTLDAKKIDDGLVALQWYKEGQIELITGYCQQRVTLIRDLFLYGELNGYVKYSTQSGVTKDLKVDWQRTGLMDSS